MNIDKLKYYIEGVSYNTNSIKEFIINEFKEFFNSVKVYRYFDPDMIIVEADEYKFEVELTFNNRLNEFKIQKVICINELLKYKSIQELHKEKYYNYLMKKYNENDKSKLINIISEEEKKRLNLEV